MLERWSRYRAEAIEPRLFIIRQLPLVGWPFVLALGALNVLLGALPVCFMLAMGVLIGRAPGAIRHGLQSAEWSGLQRAFLVASAVFVAHQLLTPLAVSLGEVLKHRVDGRFRDRLVSASLRSTGIGPLEDQSTLDSLREAAEQLQTSFRTPGDATVGTLAYLLRYTQLAGFLLVLALAGSWPAALAVFASTMAFRYGHRGGVRVWVGVTPRVIRHRRERDYFRTLGITAPAAKELRVFGLTQWAVTRYRTSAMAALLPMWQARQRIGRRFLFITAVGVVVIAATMALTVRSTANGESSLTQLVLVLQAAIAAVILGDYYPEADDATEFGMLAVRALHDFEGKVEAFADRDVAGGRDRAAADLPEREIRFDNVRFRYDGTERWVLDGLDLTLRAGECTALVGLNGAGKSTLVKLLARLHEPTSGRLLVDDIDVRQLAVDSWRSRIGVIFQDFNRYELSAADNIAFGAVQRPPDEAAVRSAAERAGIADALQTLPNGMRTILARHYEGGAELSGGQWQRLAIARALYAMTGGAKVLVLDEPTAALDVRAEAAFFDRFVDLTRGVTTLLISHRFSSVRHADRIVLLEHGRVVESGTHDELVTAGGRYARMFQLQAERFRDDPDADADADADIHPLDGAGAGR